MCPSKSKKSKRSRNWSDTNHRATNVTAATYYASASFVRYECNKNKLIDLNGLDAYHSENVKYINDAIKTAKLVFILNSSTEGSTKQFKLTIDDNGTLTISEIFVQEDE